MNTRPALRIASVLLAASLSGCTSLQTAATFGQVEKMRRLLDGGAKPDEKSLGDLRNTPLCLAVGNKHSEAARLLIERGARVNVACTGGAPPLCDAAVNGDAQSARFLLDAGADAGVKCDGKTPLEIVQERRHPDIAALLKEDAPLLAARPNDYAVVVGVSVRSAEGGARFAEHDARDMRDALLMLGYRDRNIALLTGEKASYKGMEKNIETWLARGVAENSRVFFYFSGPGARDQKSGRAYLLPSDGDLDYLETTGYPLRRLYETLSALKAKEVVAVLDADYAGSEDSLAPRGKLAALAAAEQNICVLTGPGHGAFTYYLLEGLRGPAQDESGALTPQGLFNYLSPKVQAAARAQNREQIPVLRGAAQGLEIARFK